MFFIDLGRAARVKIKEKYILYAMKTVKNRCASRSILLPGGGSGSAAKIWELVSARKYLSIYHALTRGMPEGV